MQTFLGVVTGARPDKRGERVAWVRPLLDVTTIAWREADPEEFPTRGSLFWPRATEAVLDALVFVRTKENTVHLPGIKDDFMVAEPHPALEVLDLRRIGSQEQVRTALTAGVRLSPNAPARTLIWCSDNAAIGPVSLVTTANLTTIEKNNRSRIACFHLKAADIRTVSYDGINRHVFGKANLGLPDSFVDWDDDKQVVRRAVEYAVEMARKSGATIDLTRQMVEDAAEQLTSKGSPADLQLDLYRLERSRALIKGLQQTSGVAAEVVTALRKHPGVLRELEQIKAEERESARAEAEPGRDWARDRGERIRRHSRK